MAVQPVQLLSDENGQPMSIEEVLDKIPWAQLAKKMRKGKRFDAPFIYALTTVFMDSYSLKGLRRAWVLTTQLRARLSTMSSKTNPTKSGSQWRCLEKGLPKNTDTELTLLRFLSAQPPPWLDSKPNPKTGRTAVKIITSTSTESDATRPSTGMSGFTPDTAEDYQRKA